MSAPVANSTSGAPPQTFSDKGVAPAKMNGTANGKPAAPAAAADEAVSASLDPNAKGPQLGTVDRFKQNVGAWIEEERNLRNGNEDLRDRVTFIEYYLKEKFYGDWYHNAAVIFVTSFLSWLVARLGGGLVWIVIIMAFTSTYYRTSIIRVRRNVRDDVAREAAMVKLETDAESMEWLNAFIVKFWAIYLPTLNQMVIDTANQVLSGTQTPPGIDSLELSKFTVGTKPPRIDLVRSYPKTEEDVVVMDWGFSFTPNDVADLTARQLKDKVNPLVELSIRIGKGIVSKGMPILVEDMSFKGLIQVKIKLITSFPHIQTVSVSFLRPPEFDFVLKPIGGETFGFDINFIPGLEGFIKSMVHDNIGPMFYDPNAFTVNVEQMLAGAGLDASVGVLAITIFNAHGLKGGDMLGNSVDPYIRLSASGTDEELGRTSIKRDTVTPRWNETKLILVKSLSDTLNLECYDFNDIRKDRLLGTANFQLSSLEQNPEQENQSLPLINNMKTKGHLTFEARYFPILEGRVLDDGTKEDPPPMNTGIVRFTAHQAKDLENKRMVGSINPYAVYLLDGKEIHVTKTLKRTTNPVWDDGKEVIIANRQRASLAVQIRDGKGSQGDAVLGTYKIKLEDLITSNEKGGDWFNLTPKGKVRLTAQWKPVALKGVTSSGGYVTPIGVMRFYVKSAKELRNLETVGKVDPYVRVMVNNVQKSRTVTYHSTLEPVWNEVVYATVTSDRETIVLECMDAETTGKDRTLGRVTIPVSKFLKKNAQGEYIECIDQTLHVEPLLMQGKSPKGTVTFTAAFFPTLNVVDPEEEAEEAKAAAEEAKEAAAEGSADVKQPKAAIDSKKPDQKLASKPVEPSGAKGAAAGEVGEESAEPAQPAKLKLSPDELFKYDSGLLVYKVIEGQVGHSETFFQVFFDDFLYPSYVSSRSTGRHTKWEEVGDGLVRQLEWSRFELRLTTKERALRNDDEGVIATYTGSTLAVLKNAYNNPTTISMNGRDGVSTLKISLKYIPVLMKLDPVESRNNMGNLRVDVLDATDLPAADRRGKSDPYAVFELEGDKVFKSRTIKKTLTPAWNEFFDVQVTNRIDSDFKVNVYDWDMGPAEDDFLGAAKIPLDELVPMEPKVVILPLDGKSGQIRLRLLFKPDFVLRSNQGNSTFSGTFAVPGKVVTSVAGAPIKGVGFAAGGVKKGAHMFTRGFKREKHLNGDDASSIRSAATSRQ
ncbi:C2 domain-containing protein [Dipodascopsis tothii]|uniref:C2 domain-containing protein n=1 Tax=Dipodascopsis tothii TaxID=44089 RepID=UPI0034CDCFD8